MKNHSMKIGAALALVCAALVPERPVHAGGGGLGDLALTTLIQVPQNENMPAAWQQAKPHPAELGGLLGDTAVRYDRCVSLGLLDDRGKHAEAQLDGVMRAAEKATGDTAAFAAMRAGWAGAKAVWAAEKASPSADECRTVQRRWQRAQQTYPMQ